MFETQYRREIDQISLPEERLEQLITAMGQTEPQKPSQRAGKAWKTVLLAAALCAALVATALAVELTVGWESFFGRTPREAVTAVGTSAVTGDYTLTLQEAIVDDTGAAFLLALTRNDGGVIEGDPWLSGNTRSWNVKVEGRSPGVSEHGDKLPIRSEDGKTVYYCMEFEKWEQEERSLLGQTITFHCRGIFDMARTEEELAFTREKVSLASLTSTAQKLDISCDDISRARNDSQLEALLEELSAQATVPLTRLGEGEACVSGIFFASDGPAVAVDWHKDLVWQENNLLLSRPMATALTDTRTGERWEYRSAHRVYQMEHNDGFFLSEFKDCPLTEEDLPYMEVTVSYTMEKMLSDQEVELSFSENVGHQLTKMLDQDVDFSHYGDYFAHMTQARISALRVRLTVERMVLSLGQESGQDKTSWTLVQKDGSQIPLRGSPTQLDEQLGTGWIDLEAVNENGDRRLIDPSQVEALMVGDTVIPLT